CGAPLSFFRLHFAILLLLVSVPFPFHLISHPPQYSFAADPHLLDRQPGDQHLNPSPSHDPSSSQSITTTTTTTSPCFSRSDPTRATPSLDHQPLRRISQSALLRQPTAGGRSKPQSPSVSPVEP
ncbi:hypothetical protein CCMA1212_003675, partial [Trichoderma ghanense]